MWLLARFLEAFPLLGAQFCSLSLNPHKNLSFRNTNPEYISAPTGSSAPSEHRRPFFSLAHAEPAAARAPCTPRPSTRAATMRGARATDTPSDDRQPSLQRCWHWRRKTRTSPQCLTRALCYYVMVIGSPDPGTQRDASMPSHQCSMITAEQGIGGALGCLPPWEGPRSFCDSPATGGGGALLCLVARVLPSPSSCQIGRVRDGHTLGNLCLLCALIALLFLVLSNTELVSLLGVACGVGRDI